MLQKKYILVGALCVSTLMQGAANDAEASLVVADSCSGQRLQLEDCGFHDTLPMV